MTRLMNFSKYSVASILLLALGATIILNFSSCKNKSGATDEFEDKKNVNAYGATITTKGTDPDFDTCPAEDALCLGTLDSVAVVASITAQATIMTVSVCNQDSSQATVCVSGDIGGITASAASQNIAGGGGETTFTLNFQQAVPSGTGTIYISQDCKDPSGCSQCTYVDTITFVYCTPL